MVRCHATMHLTMGIAFGTLGFDKASNAGVQLVTHQKIEKSKNQMQFFTHISLYESAGLTSESPWSGPPRTSLQQGGHTMRGR